VRLIVLVAGSLVAIVGCGQLEAVLKPPSRPPVPAVARAPQPSGPLRPELSAEEEQKFLDEARQRIGEVEKLLRELEGRQMNPPQLEALRASKSFLDQARTAMGQRDYQRAANLAGKARALGDDLATATR
jgi:hypothetical protein